MLEALGLPEFIDDLYDLAVTVTDDSELFEIEADWRVSKDGGRVKASWKRSNHENHVVIVEVTYFYSEEECEAKFGAGDYSNTRHSELLFSQLWTMESPCRFSKVIEEVEAYRARWVTG